MAVAEKSNSQGDGCYSKAMVSSSAALDALLQACPASLLRASSHEDIKMDSPINKPEIVSGNPSAT